MPTLQNRRDIIILVSVTIFALIIGVVLASLLQNQYFTNRDALSSSQVSLNLSSISVVTSIQSSSTSSQSSSSSSQIISSSSSSSATPTPTTFVAPKDYMGIKITNYLKDNGLNLGFIWSEDIAKQGHAIPVPSSLDKSDLDKKPPQPKNISEIIPIPVNCDKKNWLSFQKYNVEAPIIYASFQDMYVPKNDKTININNPIQEDPNAIARGNYLSVPIQRLLTLGAVHLPESPNPGQVGNSYIVGHTSNFPQVKSIYNTVFKTFEQRSKVGDEFLVWDKDCRKLKFRVFEVKNILAEDIDTAYKNFGDKRVVTLQGSILDANYQPTRRWLTRGEMVIE